MRDIVGCGRRAFRPAAWSRAQRRAVALSAAALFGAALLTLMTADDAMANAPSPMSTPPPSGSVVTNANGTVTVTATGSWIWTYSPETKLVEGIKATVGRPCDRRFGAGWGIIWNDPNDAGFSETYHASGLTQTVNVGSRGFIPANNDQQLQWNPADPCGTFIQTNTPHQNAGNVVGQWSASHVYANSASVPTEICVVMYDLGSRHPPKRKWTRFTNVDNTVTWSLVNRGGFDLSPGGMNCVLTSSLHGTPPPVTSPATQTAVSIPPPAPKTASPAPAAAPVTKALASAPSGSLAFTGFGRAGWTVTILGALLLVAGLFFYFVDVPRLNYWLLGRASGLALPALGSRGADRWVAGRVPRPRRRPRPARSLPPPRVRR